MEADVFPRDRPEDSILIDGAIGELSVFHQTFGYYAHGIDETTAVLPQGWRERLVRVENENTRGAVGWCLEEHDLAISKLAAGRQKDMEFVAALLRHGLVSVRVLQDRRELLEETSRRDLVGERLRRLSGSNGSKGETPAAF
jgi:hypothetical protein